MSTYRIQADSVEAPQFSGSFIGNGSGLTGVGGSTPTGSLLTTASFTSANLTFTKGDSSTFNVNISSLTGSLVQSSQTSSFTQLATGSVTASVTPTQFSIISGSSTEFLVTGTGVTMGNVVTDTHRVTGSFSVSGSLTATSIIVPTSSAYQSNLPYVVYRLPAAVTFPTSSTTTIDIFQITTSSFTEGQTLIVEGFVSLAASSSNRTLATVWNDATNLQTITYVNTATNGHFGFMARVVPTGVRYARTFMYNATNQGAQTQPAATGSIKLQLQAVNLASSFILENLTVRVQ